MRLDRLVNPGAYSRVALAMVFLFYGMVPQCSAHQIESTDTSQPGVTEGAPIDPRLWQATPEPSSLEREYLEICLRHRQTDVCALPVGYDHARERAVILANVLEMNRPFLNPQTYSEISRIIQTVLVNLDKQETGNPNSARLWFNQAVYPEAKGGSVFSGSESGDSMWLQIFYPSSRGVETSLDLAIISATDLQQYGRAVRHLEKWESTGDTELTSGETLKMEAELAFLYSTLEGAIIETSNAAAGPDFPTYVTQYLGYYGFVPSKMALWLDQHNEGSKSLIWEQIFGLSVNGYWSSINNGQDVSALVNRWQGAGFTNEDRALINELLEAGMKEGWILSGATPPFR